MVDVPNGWASGDSRISSIKIEATPCTVTTVYDQKNQQGASQQMPSGTFHEAMWNSIPQWNDRIQSVCVPRGQKLTAYKDGWGSRGPWVVNGPSMQDVPNDWASGPDKISSIKIEPNA